MTRWPCLTLSILLFAGAPAQAERADREKPLQVEAGKITIDDARKVQILEGGVVLVKGTLRIEAERVVISEDAEKYQRGTAFGSREAPVRFRQKREGRDTYIEGEAGRLEYSTASEVAELFHNAQIRSGGDQLRGDYIWYDALNEKYLARAADDRGQTTPSRVRATILPRNTAPTPDSTPARSELRLKGAEQLPASTAQ